MSDYSVPDHIDDVPPPLAAGMEQGRARALALLTAHDYQLVVPPLVEYLETLTAGDRDLDLNTVKFTDTLSGRTLGLRADQTPQIARYDGGRGAAGVRRYCYCGPVLRARPPQPWRGRESMQLGAELFNAPAPGGDWEVLRLAVDTLRAIGVDAPRLDLGHAGLFLRLAEGLPAATQKTLTGHITRRDAAAIGALAHDGEIPPATAKHLTALAAANGDIDILEGVAAALPAAQAEAPLRDLAHVARQFGDADIGVSLGDLGSYGYHTGIVFTLYDGRRIIARGGRYRQNGGGDGVGFSVDLRLAAAAAADETPAVCVPVAGDDEQWRAAVQALRAGGRRIRYTHAGETPRPPLLRQTAAGAWEIAEA